MIEACRTWLETYLLTLGIKQLALTAEEGARINAHPAAKILMEDTESRYDGSLVARIDHPETGERILRRRTYKQQAACRVKLFHRDQVKAETLRESFLAGLPARIDDGHGNAVLITAQGGEGDEDTSLLRQQGIAYVDMVFDGGIYRDKTVWLVNMETAQQTEPEIEEV